MPTTSQERQDRALSLRESGFDYEHIARELGYSNGHSAASACTYARNRRAGRPARPGARTPQRTASPDLVGRRFGVEVEYVGISRESAANALQAAGLPAAVEGYNHTVRRHWKVVTDASVSGGGEVVSPVLAGEDGIAKLKTAMKALRQAGATVNWTTGLHVHHDMNGLSGDEIARFVEFYTQRQDTMDRLVSASRREGSETGSSMFQRLRPSEVEYWTGMFRQYGRIDCERDDHRRYRTINVCSFPKYGTIEIRQHQGTLSGRKAEAWVRLAWAMLDSVQRSTDRDIQHGAAMLGDLVDKSTLPARTAAYLTQRMEALAS